MRVKRPAHHLAPSSPSVDTDSFPPPVPEKVGLGFGGRKLYLGSSSLVGPSNHCPPPYPKRGETVKAPEKQGCLGIT